MCVVLSDVHTCRCMSCRCCLCLSDDHFFTFPCNLHCFSSDTLWLDVAFRKFESYSTERMTSASNAILTLPTPPTPMPKDTVDSSSVSACAAHLQHQAEAGQSVLHRVRADRSPRRPGQGRTLAEQGTSSSGKSKHIMRYFYVKQLINAKTPSQRKWSFPPAIFVATFCVFRCFRLIFWEKNAKMTIRTSRLLFEAWFLQWIKYFSQILKKGKCVY
jgi:hypothetical protein